MSSITWQTQSVAYCVVTGATNTHILVMPAIVLVPAGVRAVCYPGFTPRTLDVVQQYRPGALAESGER